MGSNPTRVKFSFKHLFTLIRVFRVYRVGGSFIYTAISINVVGSKLQAYATRPNGGLGIHRNLQMYVQMKNSSF